MGNEISQQLAVSLQALCLGLLWGAFFDFLRALCRRFPGSRLRRGADLLFCLCCTVSLALFVLHSGGELRLYLLAALLLGALLYLLLLHRPLWPLWLFLADCCRDYLRLLLLPGRLLQRVLLRLKKYFQKLFHFYVKCFIIKNYRRDAGIRQQRRGVRGEKGEKPKKT